MDIDNHEEKKSITLPRIETGKPGKKPIDWARADEEYLPLVSEAIDDIRKGESGLSRPRITKGSVERYLQLPSGSLSKMLQCRALVETE